MILKIWYTISSCYRDWPSFFSFETSYSNDALLLHEEKQDSFFWKNYIQFTTVIL